VFLFFAKGHGCVGSLLISIIGSLLLFMILRGCNAA